MLNDLYERKRKTEDILESLINENTAIKQEKVDKLNTIKQINLEIENNFKQINSLKNLKEQLKKMKVFKRDWKTLV